MHLLRRLLQAGSLLMLALAVPLADSRAQAPWQPTKPIEFVIMAGKGGGADLIVRSIKEIIDKHKLTPVPIMPVNIAGGSGADTLYGGVPALGLTRQALHAARLSFVHPITGESLRFEAPLPPDMAEAWALLESSARDAAQNLASGA